MKTLLVVFTMLISMVGFGQQKVVEKKTTIYCSIKLCGDVSHRWVYVNYGKEEGEFLYELLKNDKTTNPFLNLISALNFLSEKGWVLDKAYSIEEKIPLEKEITSSTIMILKK